MKPSSEASSSRICSRVEDVRESSWSYPHPGQTVDDAGLCSGRPSELEEPQRKFTVGNGPGDRKIRWCIGQFII